MVSIKVFIISLILCIILTLMFGFLLFDQSTKSFKKRITYMIEWIAYWLQRLWYAIIFITSGIFVVINFDTCIQLSFTRNFNGYNVVFLFFLFLMLLPLFDRFEGFGINLKRRNQNSESAQAAIKAMDLDNILSIDDLKKLNKTENSDE